jgi:hypothetical protein
MRSKLLQKQTYSVNQSREVVNGQQENIEDSSMPWRAQENPASRARSSWMRAASIRSGKVRPPQFGRRAVVVAKPQRP